MVRIFPILELVIKLVVGALILHLHASVEAYEIIFSNDTTTDFINEKIDVPGFVRQDWLYLPIIGFCGLAGKFNRLHPIDTSSIHGTFYTTFEYLTSDCTAEYKRDINSCALLTSAFGACFNFPLDKRMSNRPWGYCSNFNFRVSYLWVRTPNATTPSFVLENSKPLSKSNWKMPPKNSKSLSKSKIWKMPSTCSSFNCKTHDPIALESISKDIASLKMINLEQSCTSFGGRLDTSCNWRYSNLVPVAWDGIQNVLMAGQSLQSSDSLYALIMQTDCNLVLYKKGVDGKYDWNAKWASFSQFNDPFIYNCSLELQPNGNLVVLDPLGKPRWQSGGNTSVLYTSVLSITRKGMVVVYEMTSGGVLWSTG